MKHVLILEDTLSVVAKLVAVCDQLEQELAMPIVVTVHAQADAVSDYVNQQQADVFDAIILDRNCKQGGSFHILDLEKFGANKVISISSLPRYNREAAARGVAYSVDKDLQYIDQLAVEVKYYLRQILSGS